MGTRTTLRKVFFILFWVMVGGGILSLLIAAIGKKNKGLCTGYEININNGEERSFFDEKDIQQLLLPVLGNDIRQKNTAELDLGRYEKLLRANYWIRDAELWFDSKNKLHISVQENTPIARVFPREGNSFLVDEQNQIMPLSRKKVLRLPVFTGFPDKRLLNKKDSVVLGHVTSIAKFIHRDNFWKSQVAQVNITEDETFEMIPVVGDHLVKLGDGNEIQKKLNRLMIFYKEVLKYKGFNAYTIIDVQYKGQVIGTRSKQTQHNVDMVSLKKNVERLLNQKTDVKTPVVANENPIPDDQPEKGVDTKSNIPNTLKTTSLPGSEKENERVPKAVMPKRDTTNQ